jgi:hypothetical protein
MTCWLAPAPYVGANRLSYSKIGGLPGPQKAGRNFSPRRLAASAAGSPGGELEVSPFGRPSSESRAPRAARARRWGLPWAPPTGEKTHRADERVLRWVVLTGSESSPARRAQHDVFGCRSAQSGATTQGGTSCLLPKHRFSTCSKR